ncbi:hypothetical protein [Macrococcoides caseolyticum]|uniref:hypothetical protein n=1 Tax=Macrococcoides caseolyticum TaxID=69966 RepID=UPI001F188CB7|nr:hypothetical protein [Macrococcus caseolyticus]MCE4956400.1 hypothetical protein [Macrococcus caseolyticus]
MLHQRKVDVNTDIIRLLKDNEVVVYQASIHKNRFEKVLGQGPEMIECNELEVN